MFDLRKIVYQAISTYCPRCYYGQAAQGCEFPYIVFSFPSNGRAYKEQVARELEVAIYDAPKSGYNVANEIDTLTDNVKASLDYKTGSQDATSVWFKFEQRTEVPFPDGATIWGRVLRFTAHTYKE